VKIVCGLSRLLRRNAVKRKGQSQYFQKPSAQVEIPQGFKNSALCISAFQVIPDQDADPIPDPDADPGF
jgi:hypothetical protein